MEYRLSTSLSLTSVCLALGVVSSWGLHLVIIRVGVQVVPPELLLCLRFLCTALVFVPFAKRLSRPDLISVMKFTASMYIAHFGFLFFALTMLNASTFALIMQIHVAMIVILAWLFEKERFGLKTFAGVVVGFIGAFLIFGSPDITSIKGLFLAIGAALSAAFGTIHLRSVRHLSIASLSGWCSLLALPFAVLGMLLFKDIHVIDVLASSHKPTILFVLFYQVVCMSLAMYVWAQLISSYTMQSVTSFSMLQPFFTVIFGFVFLSETLSLQSLIGGSIAFIGVGIIHIRKTQKAEEKTIKGQ